jgi:exosortase A-associated hydrolase 1
MTRRHLTFACEGATLVGTLDDATGATGLLIVTGGNETRAGAWNGQARMAARIAAEGFPVFRFDRRGVGDSEGMNAGFRGSAADIAAALAAFRAACPQVRRVVALGNCDAASALMLSHGAGLDALVLSNPWTIEGGESADAPEVIRDHYRRRLSDPRALLRLVTGKVSFASLFRSLLGALRKPPEPTTLAQDMASALASFPGEVRLLLAGRDRTAIAFRAAWAKNDPRIRTCEGATHSFVEPEAQAWCLAQVLEVLGPA